MKKRCTNPKYQYYERYGGRGITFDPNWRDFTAFLSDMGLRPEGKTLDRIDSNGHYTKSNCCWSDAVAQSSNRRTNILVTINGQTRTVTQWCPVFGVTPRFVFHRLHGCGWQPLEALVTPKGYKRCKS